MYGRTLIGNELKQLTVLVIAGQPMPMPFKFALPVMLPTERSPMFTSFTSTLF
jgi:hypothetical protein